MPESEIWQIASILMSNRIFMIIEQHYLYNWAISTLTEFWRFMRIWVVKMRICLRDSSSTSTYKGGRFSANYTKLKTVFIFHIFLHWKGYNGVLPLNQIIGFLISNFYKSSFWKNKDINFKMQQRQWIWSKMILVR